MRIVPALAPHFASASAATSCALARARGISKSTWFADAWALALASSDGVGCAVPQAHEASTVIATAATTTDLRIALSPCPHRDQGAVVVERLARKVDGVRELDE